MFQLYLWLPCLELDAASITRGNHHISVISLVVILIGRGKQYYRKIHRPFVSHRQTVIMYRHGEIYLTKARCSTKTLVVIENVSINRHTAKFYKILVMEAP